MKLKAKVEKIEPSIKYEICFHCGTLCRSNECTSCSGCSLVSDCEKKKTDNNVVRKGFCPECEEKVAFACVNCGTLYACVGCKCADCSRDKRMACLELEPVGKKIIVVGTCNDCETAKSTWEKVIAEEKRPREFKGENAERILWTFKGCFMKIVRFGMAIRYQCPGFVGVVAELIENGMSMNDAKKALDKAMDEAMSFVRGHDTLRTVPQRDPAENRCVLLKGCPIRDEENCTMDRFLVCYARKYVQKGYGTERATFDYYLGACVKVL